MPDNTGVRPDGGWHDASASGSHTRPHDGARPDITRSRWQGDSGDLTPASDHLSVHLGDGEESTAVPLSNPAGAEDEDQDDDWSAENELLGPPFHRAIIRHETVQGQGH